MVSQYVCETTSDCARVSRRRAGVSGTTYQDDCTDCTNAMEAAYG